MPVGRHCSKEPPFQSLHPALPTDTYDRVFNILAADVILRTTDGVLFALQKSTLCAHSLVFKTTIDSLQAHPGQDQSGPSSKYQMAPGILPVVQISETAPQVRDYLYWIHQHTYKRAFRTFTQRWLSLNNESIELLWLLDCAWKYKTFSITTTVLGALTWQDMDAWPETLLAFGVLFRSRPVVERAIRGWVKGRKDGWPLHSVQFMWPCLVERVPRRMYPHLAAAVDMTYQDNQDHKRELAQAAEELGAEPDSPGGDSAFLRELEISVERQDNRVKMFMEAYERHFPPM